jgi:hypothetical protein
LLDEAQESPADVLVHNQPEFLLFDWQHAAV